MKDILEIEKVIGVKFKHSDNLREALTHRSFINENAKLGRRHNERLEFLGDAVLELIISDYLFRSFPEHPEGELTKFRAAIVNTETLAEVAKELGLNGYLFLSKGEAKQEGRARDRILANTFEAMLGAIYIDQGHDQAFKKTKELVLRVLVPKLACMFEDIVSFDPKSQFQAKAQELLKITPIYKVLKESGEDHEKSFVVGVFLGEELVAKGVGVSKKDAEKKAAENGITLKKW